MKTGSKPTKRKLVYKLLLLTDDKTEVLLIKSNGNDFSGRPAPPTSRRVGSADISFTTCARSLGFMISDSVSLDKHVSNVCRSAYVKIRRISSIRQYLTVDTTKTLVCIFVLPNLIFVILFCLAAQLTFSEDYKKFRTLTRNWSSNHADVIMTRNLFFKLSIGYRSKPESITNCQISVATSSLTHPLPASQIF